MCGRCCDAMPRIKCHPSPSMTRKHQGAPEPQSPPSDATQLNDRRLHLSYFFRLFTFLVPELRQLEQTPLRKAEAHSAAN